MYTCLSEKIQYLSSFGFFFRQFIVVTNEGVTDTNALLPAGGSLSVFIMWFFLKSVLHSLYGIVYCIYNYNTF